jgi:hypothetical protein
MFLQGGIAKEAVFLNCPFDSAYKDLFRALVFTVAACGFQPRCALEIDDGAGTRIDKILALIGECPFGIHDISRTEADLTTGLPRFNMPLELGLFLGARAFGNKRQKAKRCLVLDKERFRYRQFVSDIAGQDIHAHGNSAQYMVGEVRDFLRANSGARHIPSGKRLFGSFMEFESKMPAICAALDLDAERPTFMDLAFLMTRFLERVAS